MRTGRKFGVVIGAAALLVVAAGGSDAAQAKKPPRSVVENYGWKDSAGYAGRWAAPYGPGEGTTSFRNNSVTIDAAPFTTAFDYSVFDHLKYIRVSTDSFSVPQTGSLEFSVEIDAETPGTQDGRVVHGCYGPPFSWDGVAPCSSPWSQTALEGQQAGVVLNMINFQTGQLFDWFVSEGHVFALIERLPTSVTGSPGVGLDKAYTQIIKEQAVSPNRKHTVAIRYTRAPGSSIVDYFLDHKLFAHVEHVGIPLDKQGVPFTGTRHRWAQAKN